MAKTFAFTIAYCVFSTDTGGVKGKASGDGMLMTQINETSLNQSFLLQNMQFSAHSFLYIGIRFSLCNYAVDIDTACVL